MSGNNPELRGLWLAVIVLGGLVGGGFAGVVFRGAGVDLAGSLGAGGATFVGLVTLGLAARKFLTD